jgi:L-ascorbate metabolism protein UlaG (beta-lactamase superfamily)
MIERIQWLGSGSFVIHPETPQHAPLVYINPWRVTRAERPADVILISSERFDRCSLADIDKIRGDHTKIIASERAAEQLDDCSVLRSWQSISLDNLCVKAVPAVDSLSKRDTGIGFVISMQFYDIYYAGDTGLFPEMSRLHPDIALLPIDGMGTLNTSEAMIAAKSLGARWVIPYNWGKQGATRLDAVAVARELNQTLDTVVVLSPNA